jgi:hypothetical protein
MLHAILSGNKRGSGVEGESLSVGFSGAEDLLTATVFERLSYLPDQLLCELLFAEEIWHERVVCPCKLVAFRYWPRWEGFLPDSYKIPDCVIEFEDRVLIIEAKRFDFMNQQRPTQLASEWLAGKRVHPDKSLWLLAVGGLANSRSETVRKLSEAVHSEVTLVAAGSSVTDEVHFAALPWFGLFKVIKGWCERKAWLGPHTMRLLDDIREGMLLHGVSVSPPTWLVDLTGTAWKPSRGMSRGLISAFVRLPSRTWAEFRPIVTSPTIFAGGFGHDVRSS